MSSNKIGFFSALGLYASIIIAIWLIDFKIKIIGEMGESKVFSIQLDNVAGESFGIGQKEQKKVVQKNDKKPTNQPLQESTQELQQPTQTNDLPNNDLSNNNSSDLSGGGASNAQIAMGENDPYFIAITRIINKFHAREPVRNMYGVVGVEFSINIDGELENLRVIISSGNARLDSIALKTIRRASRTFPTPKKNYYIKTTLVYKRS